MESKCDDMGSDLRIPPLVRTGPILYEMSLEPVTDERFDAFTSDSDSDDDSEHDEGVKPQCDLSLKIE